VTLSDLAKYSITRSIARSLCDIHELPRNKTLSCW